MNNRTVMMLTPSLIQRFSPPSFSSRVLIRWSACSSEERSRRTSSPTPGDLHALLLKLAVKPGVGLGDLSKISLHIFGQGGERSHVGLVRSNFQRRSSVRQSESAALRRVTVRRAASAHEATS